MIFIQVTKIIGLILCFSVIGTRTYIALMNLKCMLSNYSRWEMRWSKKITHTSVCISEDFSVHFAYCVLMLVSVLSAIFYIFGIAIRRLVLLLPWILFEHLMTVFLTLAAVIASHFKTTTREDYVWALSIGSSVLSALLLIVFLIMRRSKTFHVMPPEMNDDV